MSIKNTMVRIAEKITGRKCCACAHNRGGRCCHPDGNMFMRCFHSITRPGFEYSTSLHIQGRNNKMELAAPGDLTPEEKHQLGKIVESLQEASATAQDAGLLEEDDQETEATRQRRATYWEDKTESGLLEED